MTKEVNVKSLWTSIDDVKDFGLSGECKEDFNDYPQRMVHFDKLTYRDSWICGFLGNIKWTSYFLLVERYFNNLKIVDIMCALLHVHGV